VVSPHGSAIPSLIIQRTQVVLQAVVPLSSSSLPGQMGYVNNFLIRLLLDLLDSLVWEFLSVPHHVVSLPPLESDSGDEW
jgi:hypothetical protein